MTKYSVLHSESFRDHFDTEEFAQSLHQAISLVAARHTRNRSEVVLDDRSSSCGTDEEYSVRLAGCEQPVATISGHETPECGPELQTFSGPRGQTTYTLQTHADHPQVAATVAREWADQLDEVTASRLRLRTIYIALKATHVGVLYIQSPDSPVVRLYA